jgi:putative ABC transport system substrate-binding protein
MHRTTGPAWASRTGRVTTRRAWLGRIVALLAIASSTTVARARRARVGWLALSPLQGTSARDQSQRFFLSALQQKGWSESGNLVFEDRRPASDKTLSASAAELVALRPDVLVSAGTPAIRILRDLTADIPIVIAGAGDPVGTGLVDSLTRPGGNVTGVSWRLDELIPKTLSLLHEMVPRARRVDLVNQAIDPSHAFFAKVMTEAARSRGLVSLAHTVDNADDLVSLIAASPADALILIAIPMIYANPQRIAEAAIRRGLPLAITGGPGRAPTVAGALFSYCANYDEILRRTADFVDRILRGARPADMPVELTLRYDLVFNLKTARAIGLTVPQVLLLLADELIE